MLSVNWVNTPCYIIVGGRTGNEGTVITRDPEGVNRTETLSSSKWYVAQTNLDFWMKSDSRYNATVSNLEKMT